MHTGINNKYLISESKKKFNIFKNCLNLEVTINKPFYFIGNTFANTLNVICIDSLSKKIYSYSNEWLYLIKHYYDSHQTLYLDLVSNYYNLLQIPNIDERFSNDNIIPFITSFSSGTAHGYCGLFFILNEYISYRKKYKDYKIAIYPNSQSGIIDILNHFINKKILDKNKIIRLSSSIKYLFKSVRFIPNKWHSYPKKFNLKIIKKYIICEEIQNKLSIINSEMCIIKNSQSHNITSCGVVQEKIVKIFCKQNNLILLEPGKINEIELINYLYSSSRLILSWGTSFFKNYIYISSRCKKITVFVIGDEFRKQYYRVREQGDLIEKYKDAMITYILVDTHLNVIS